MIGVPLQSSPAELLSCCCQKYASESGCVCAGRKRPPPIAKDQNIEYVYKSSLPTAALIIMGEVIDATTVPCLFGFSAIFSKTKTCRLFRAELLASSPRTPEHLNFPPFFPARTRFQAR